MLYTTDPAARERFITGLCDLAACLDARPNVPVPSIGATINLHVASTEDGGRGQVAHIAAQLGVTISDDTLNGGHLTAVRMFGPVGYMVVSIPATVMADHRARDSYYRSVTPELS